MLSRNLRLAFGLTVVLSFLMLASCAEIPIGADAIVRAARGDWNGALRQAGNDVVDHGVNQEVYVKAINLACENGAISGAERDRRLYELQEAYRLKQAGLIRRQDFHWKAAGLCTVGNQNYFDLVRAQYGW